MPGLAWARWRRQAMRWNRSHKAFTVHRDVAHRADLDRAGGERACGAGGIPRRRGFRSVESRPGRLRLDGTRLTAGRTARGPDDQLIASVKATLSAGVQARLDAMERNIDTVAIELERVSEGQRFTAKLLEQRPLEHAQRSDR